MKWISRGVKVFAMGLMAFVWSCSDDEMTDNEYVNRWIQSQMQEAYLWNKGMPSPKKSLNPEAYFNALKSSEDRFSWIQENYADLINSLNGVNKEAGYEYKLYRWLNNTVVMQIMYIKEGSLVETEDVDLMRGDRVEKINGKTLTIDNYRDVLPELSEPHTLTYSRYNHATDTWEAKDEVSLNTAQFAENPNLLSKVITVGNKKIGYYVYNFFAEGPTETSTVYDDEMATIFAEFKAAGITDLIIDLRYNSGGSIGSSARLASLIGNNISTSNIFTRFQYNDELQAYFIEEYGEEDLQLNFISTPNAVGSLISNRVYFLTSKRTASASELVINGLKPYMSQIVLIGDTTIGKNVGSATLYERNNPRNKWGLQPIIVKLYNSQNQADYDDGFIPDIIDADDEFEIYPLGDVNEKLLGKAIDQITGVTVARKARKDKTLRQEIGTSADFRQGGYNLIMNDRTSKDWVKKITTRSPDSF